MTTAMPANTPDQGQIRQRFALLLILVGLPIVALIGTLAWRSYNQAYNTVIEQLERDLTIRRNGLEQLAADTHSHVEMLKAFAESQLAMRKDFAPYSGPLDWPGTSLDPGPAGGLIMSPPDGLITTDRQEISAISALFPMLQAAHHARGYLRWSYYFPATEKFVAIYPWASADQMMQGASTTEAFNSYFAYDIYKMAEPTNNTRREPYWTPVYFDAGGSGMMVSHGSPVYIEGQFVGMVGTDVLLQHLGDFLAQFPDFAGDVVLVDQNGSVVAVPGKSPNDGKAPVPATTILGDISSLELNGRISERDHHLVAATAVSGTPWTIVLRTDGSAARTAALASIQPLVAILSSLILMLVALAWLFRNQFVAPAVALVDYATRSSGKSSPAPTLPKPFQPLLASLRQSRTSDEDYVRQMRAMIDSMPLRVGYVDDKLIYRDINQRLLDFLGLKREEVIGKTLEEILGPTVAQQYQDILPRVMKGETVKWEGWAEFPKQGRHYLHRLIMPFAPEGGAPGTLTFTQDTTDAELAAQALAEKEALNRAVVSGALDAIVVMDEYGTTLQWNPAAEQIFGYTADEAIGSKVGDLIVPPNMRDMHKRGMEQYVATGEARVLGKRLELDGMRKDGSLIPIELTITESEVEGRRLFTSHLRDITQKKAAEADLQRTRATLQSIFDNVPAALYMRDRDDRLVMMNKWGAAFLGRPLEEMLGQPMRNIREPQNVERVQQVDENIIKTGKPETHEFVYHLPGGDRHGLMTFFPVHNSSGDVTHIGGMMVDVTELNKARRDLEQAQSLIKSIFDNAPFELYLRELDGNYVMMNKWGANYVGVENPQDMVGRSFAAFDSPEEIELSFEAQRRMITTGDPVTRDFHYQIDGKTMTLQNTIFPIRGTDGEIARIGGVSIDVTALNQARDQLQRAQDNLHQSEKLAALGQLLAGVAHELNNPLAVVLGRAAILQEKLKGTPHAAPLQKMRDAADRCARIVKTFLAMARQTGPRREMVKISDVIESALEMTTYSLRKHNVTWNTSIQVADEAIEIDEDQIVQVLINLILNAQQALNGKADDRRLNINVEICPKGDSLSITVADNGPGVPAEIANRIFDPFFTTKGVGEGTGLGLSVCKSMVEGHGGSLTLETTRGGGATFRVVLPMQTGMALVPKGRKVTEQSAASGRILVVDDEVEIAAILADCLAPLGVECVIAGDGKAALKHISEKSFDAIFCDVSMPGMDGITFYDKLRTSNPVLASHFVFISGDVLHRDFEKLKSRLDRPIIEKPFDPQLVRDAALRMLNQEVGTT